MPKLELDRVAVKSGSLYPEPYAAMMAGRSSLRLGEAGGLTQFGVRSEERRVGKECVP